MPLKKGPLRPLKKAPPRKPMRVEEIQLRVKDIQLKLNHQSGNVRISALKDLVTLSAAITRLSPEKKAQLTAQIINMLNNSHFLDMPRRATAHTLHVLSGNEDNRMDKLARSLDDESERTQIPTEALKTLGALSASIATLNPETQAHIITQVLLKITKKTDNYSDLNARKAALNTLGALNASIATLSPEAQADIVHQVLITLSDEGYLSTHEESLAALRSLSEVIHKIPTRIPIRVALINQLLDVVNGRSDYARLEAAETLANFTPDISKLNAKKQEVLLEQLAEMLTARHPPMRQAALKTLGALNRSISFLEPQKQEQLTDEMIKLCLYDTTPEVREEAVSALEALDKQKELHRQAFRLGIEVPQSATPKVESPLAASTTYKAALHDMKPKEIKDDNTPDNGRSSDRSEQP